MESPADHYRSFLQAKVPIAQRDGLEIDRAEIHPWLKPHAAVAVRWAIRGGRRALFASFGMAKTSMQIELMRLVLRHAGGEALITLPLGVRQEFMRDAAAMGQQLRFIRRPEEIEKGAIHLTNYETVRDGKLDPGLFTATSLDEADVLRGFGGSKTFREFMRLYERVRYRFLATATPSPNEYIELLAYAAYLGIMDVGQAKTRFFKRNSEDADNLTLHPHKEREFWLWVASWALFLQKPSDLGFSDEGYELPALDIRWHEVASDHSRAGEEWDGQQRLFHNAAIGVSEAAREKRLSLPARVEKLLELRAEDPAAHRIIWHDLEAERHAIENALPNAVAIWGSQDLDEREKRVIDFSDGRIQELAAKPVIAGAGTNFQRHCHWEIFLGIGFKFRDLIQAIHRCQRFGQQHRVRIDLIYTEAERDVRRSLEAKWARHEDQARVMAGIIREYGLAEQALLRDLARSIGVARTEARGERFTAVNNDCVEETRAMADDSVDLIVTSIPFSTQYEYTPSYNDFGHSEDDGHFWHQMDFLTPELLRVLRPGRVAAIHVKDRVVPGGLTGLGFQTVSPFSDDCVAHFRRHGFAFLARKTIVTDVVRENNQTYRLGWTEQCKDGSRMGAGLPEYLLLFRKPPTDPASGYADLPVAKEKPRIFGENGEPMPWQRLPHGIPRPVPGTGYSRGRWQLDAHGFTRSSGERLIGPEDLVGQAQKIIYRRWKRANFAEVYDFDHHVALCEALDAKGELPPVFMLLPPHSWHPDVWTDVTRMRSLNGAQYAAGKEMHLCPMQFDIADRAIVQFSMKGELVFDPFMGLGTVPLRALQLGRRGLGTELNPAYFRDAVAYLEAAERDAAVPTLFQLLEAEPEAAE